MDHKCSLQPANAEKIPNISSSTDRYTKLLPLLQSGIHSLLHPQRSKASPKATIFTAGLTEANSLQVACHFSCILCSRENPHSLQVACHVSCILCSC